MADHSAGAGTSGMEDDERWGGERTPSPLHRTGTLTSAEVAGLGQAMGSPLELPDEPDDAGGGSVTVSPAVCINISRSCCHPSRARP